MSRPLAEIQKLNQKKTGGGEKYMAKCISLFFENAVKCQVQFEIPIKKSRQCSLEVVISDHGGSWQETVQKDVKGKVGSSPQAFTSKMGKK